MQKFQPQTAFGRQAHEASYASQDQGKGKGKNKGKGSPQNPQPGKGTTSDVSNGGLLNAIIRLVDRAKKNPSGLLQRLEQLTSAAVNGQPLGKKTKKKKKSGKSNNTEGAAAPSKSKGKGAGFEKSGKGKGDSTAAAADNSWLTVVKGKGCLPLNLLRNPGAAGSESMIGQDTLSSQMCTNLGFIWIRLQLDLRVFF